MYPDIASIKKILLKESYISEADSKKAEDASHDSAGYIDYLIREDLLVILYGLPPVASHSSSFACPLSSRPWFLM